LIRAKEFVQRDLVEIPSGVSPHVLVNVTIARTIVDEMVGGLVREATQASVGLRGEVQSVTSGIFGGKGVANSQSHSSAGGASCDWDIVLRWLFGGWIR